jgi:hypothetical protein
VAAVIDDRATSGAAAGVEGATLGVTEVMGSGTAWEAVKLSGA